MTDLSQVPTEDLLAMLKQRQLSSIPTDQLIEMAKNHPDAQKSGNEKGIPPLPPGFKLDQPGAPQLPPGFTLDSPPARSNLMTALRNADAAGDTEAATRIAAMIKAQGSGASAQSEPSALDQLGRQLGLTGRYAMEGVGNALGVVTDPFGQFLPGYQKTGEAAGSLADKLGLPKPQTNLEKDVAGAAKALTAAGTTAGAGAIAGAAPLAENFGTQALSAMLGGGAQESAKNAGASEGAQAVTGALASLLPGARTLSAGALRGLARGGETGRQGVADAIENFAAAGTTPSVGQATQSPIARSIEAVLSKLPGGHGVMVGRANEQASDIGQALQGYADQLAPRTNPTIAGRAIDQGISGGGGFVDRFKDKAKELYDVVDQYVPSGTAVPMPATQTLLQRLTTPIRGAEATSAVLGNPKLQGIADAITSDTQNSQINGITGALPPGSVTFNAQGQPTLGQGGTMPYEAVKALRSKVGDMIADAGLVSDVPKGQLKQLYGALSVDIRNQVSQDPAAFAAANRAENYYRAGMDRIDKVDSIVGKNGGPEAVFQAATSGTREGATTLRAVMRSLQPDEANIVTSAVIRRMGRANPSAQNEIGDRFSTETFLTNWNGMSPEAKSTLFGRGGQEFADNMDKIANVASNLREGTQVYRNPSGTSHAAAAANTATGFIISMLTGNVGAATAIAGGVGTANLGARLMTSPTFVKWLSQQTTRPAYLLPAQIGYLSNLGQNENDPDLVQAGSSLARPSRDRTDHASRTQTRIRQPCHGQSEGRGRQDRRAPS